MKSLIRKKNFMIKLSITRCLHFWKSNSTVIHRKTTEISGLNKYKIDKIKSSRKKLMKCLHLMVHQWHIRLNKIKLYMSNRLQVLQTMLNHKIRQGEVMLQHVDQKHKDQQGQDKWTLIRLDHFINLENMFRKMELTLIPFKMVIELQVNLIEKTQLNNRLVMVSWSRWNTTNWRIILKSNRSLPSDCSWLVKLKIHYKEKGNS